MKAASMSKPSSAARSLDMSTASRTDPAAARSGTAEGGRIVLQRDLQRLLSVKVCLCCCAVLSCAVLCVGLREMEMTNVRTSGEV